MKPTEKSFWCQKCGEIKVLTIPTEPICPDCRHTFLPQYSRSDFGMEEGRPVGFGTVPTRTPRRNMGWG